MALPMIAPGRVGGPTPGPTYCLQVLSTMVASMVIVIHTPQSTAAGPIVFGRAAVVAEPIPITSVATSARYVVSAGDTPESRCVAVTRVGATITIHRDDGVVFLVAPDAEPGVNGQTIAQRPPPPVQAFLTSLHLANATAHPVSFKPLAATRTGAKPSAECGLGVSGSRKQLAGFVVAMLTPVSVLQALEDHPATSAAPMPTLAFGFRWGFT